MSLADVMLGAWIAALAGAVAAGALWISGTSACQALTGLGPDRVAYDIVRGCERYDPQLGWVALGQPEAGR